MAYIALKPCRFAGQSFRIGESIPDEMLYPGAAKNLVKMQIIAPADALNAAPQTKKPTPASTIGITVHAVEGDLPLELTGTGLQQIFDVLSTNVEEAEAIISEMTDADALILLHISDARKGVKAAAEDRAKALNEAQEESEEPEEPEESAGEQ